jgi:hypothetical protein
MRLVVIQQREDDDAIFTPGVRLEVQRKKRVIQTFLDSDDEQMLGEQSDTGDKNGVASA